MTGTKKRPWQNEAHGWLAAFAICVMFSLILGMARLYSAAFLSFEFELCIFYVPTLVLGIIAAKMWHASSDGRF